jgi:hypothetical protein
MTAPIREHWADVRPHDRYARVSTVEQDLTVQREGLQTLGVDPERIYVDHGLTGATELDPASGKRWPPAGPATPSSSPSSTGSPGRCPTPAISPTSGPAARSS